MCAINGCTGKNVALVEKMNSLLSHRGPDGTAVWSDGNVTLGHNRLSIIDLRSIANQPMANRRGDLVIVYNGELYNFRELRALLPGYQFVTESDTEVILAAYQEWGEQCLIKFNGIFAFAIWNTSTEELFLARDGSGVKPLYYAFYQGAFLFSSELKALLEAGVSRAIDSEALELYFRLLYVPEPSTMFKEVKKFPAGHYGYVKKGKLALTSYISSEFSYLSVPENDLKAMVRTNLEESVKRQLVSDRPVGIYLSGGIDSSAVLYSANMAGASLDTFSVGFELDEGEEAEKFNQDFLFARRTAAFYGARHHEILLSSKDIVPSFESVIWHMDEPVSNPTELAMFKLSEFVKPYVTVVLGGDGGDELFGGYDRYRLSVIADLYQRIPHAIRALFNYSERFQKLNTSKGAARLMLFMAQKDHVLREVLSQNLITNSAYNFFERRLLALDQSRPFEELFMEIDRTTWLRDESLLRSDKMGMAHGVEVRVPFLDKRMVALSEQIPARFKVGPRNTKFLLKEAFRDRIPEYLFNRPKTGWFSPAAKWLRHDHMVSFAKEVLSPSYYEQNKNLFNWKGIETMLSAHQEKRVYNLTMIWALLTFQIWARRFQIKV